MFVKICGITTKEDGLLAAALGASAVGFVFAESQRQIDFERARELSEALPPAVLRTGVFVDSPAEEIVRGVREARIDLVQLHGDEPPELIDELKRSLQVLVIKSFRVKGGRVIGRPELYAEKADFFLLDTYDEKLKGGTGRDYDRNAILQLKNAGVPVIAAGGVNPENVNEIAVKYRPFGVDVSSGVEKSPGVKSKEKMQEFFRRLHFG